VGCNVAFYGMSGSVAESAGYVAGSVVLGWIVYWLNQRAVENELVPQRDGLKRLLSEFDNGAEE
jgi:hypothetical protein